MLYLNMIRDKYNVGSVPTRTGVRLRTSCTVFMVGLVAGIVLYIGVYTRDVVAGGIA